MRLQPCAFRIFAEGLGLLPNADPSAIVPIAAAPLRIGPIPAQIRTRARWDGANSGNGNESAKRYTSNDRAVIGTPHPWASKPVGSACPARRTAPSRCSSPTRLTTPARIDAGAWTGAGAPVFLDKLDCCDLARPAGRSVLGYISGSSCLTNGVRRQSHPHRR
jgi:hypothetical protein